MKISVKPSSFFSGLFRRFAAPAVLCVFIAVVSVWQSGLVYEDTDAYRQVRDLLSHLSTIGWSSLCWAVAGCCLRERYGWHWLAGWIAAACGAGVVALFPDATGVYGGLMAVMVCLCFHGVSGREDRAVRLAQVCGRFFACLGVSLVLFIALEITVSAIPSLLLPDLPSRVSSTISGGVVALCFEIAAPWLFLGSIPRADEPAAPKSGFRTFAAVLLLPLYLILLAVLLVYVVKILLTWTMPVGVMNGYALAGLTMFTGFHLVLTGEENRISRLFTRWGGLLLIPILIAQQVGVWMRLDAYGFTPSRIYGIAVTLLCAAVVISAILRRRADWFFIAAAVVVLLVAVSPLNAVTLSRWDQETRLRAALERNGMLTDSGEIAPNPAVPAEDRAVIYSAVDYLAQSDAPEGSLTAALQTQLEGIKEEQGAYYVNDTCKLALLGFRQSEDWYARYLSFQSSITSIELDTRGYDHARWITGDARVPDEDDQPQDAEPSPYTMIAAFDIHSVTDALACYFTGDAVPVFPDVPVAFTIDGETITLNPLIATAVDVTEDATSRTRIYQLTENEIALPSGRVFRVAHIAINDYNDDRYTYSSDHMTVTGWLLTPEAE